MKHKHLSTTERPQWVRRWDKALRFNAQVIFVVCLVLGGALSCAAAAWGWVNQRHAVQAEFDRMAQLASKQLQERITLPVYGLAGARATYAATQGFNRAQFRSYVAARDLPKEFPGVLGFAFVASERLEGAPDTHYLVRFMEPASTNALTLGSDIGAEPVHRAAFEDAKRSGQPTLSAPVQWRQNLQPTLGLLLNLPVYTRGVVPDTPAQREHEFAGVLSAPIVISQMLEKTGFMQDYKGQYAIRISDVTISEANPVLWFKDGWPLTATAAFQSDVTLLVWGRQVRLDMQSTRRFNQMHASSWPIAVLVGGWLLSFGVAWRWRQLRQLKTAKQVRGLASKQEVSNFTVLANKTSNAVIFTDKHGRITWINAGFERLTGYTQAEVLGQNPGRLLQCVETDRVEVAVLREHLKAEKQYIGELLNQKKDGRHYWVELRINPLYDVDGALSGFVSIELDVTQRRLTQQRLSRAVMQNSNLVDAINATAIVSITDKKGNIIQVNDRFCQISGYTVKELLGQTHALVNSGADGLTDWREVWQVIGSGKTWSGEVCNRAKNGHLYWVDTSITPFVDLDGEIERYVSIRFDITARRQAEKEALEKTSLMYSAIDTIGEAFCLYDQNDQLVYFNQQYAEMYAASTEAIVIGNTFENIVRYGAERGQYLQALGRVDDWVAERVAVHQSANSNLIQQLHSGRILRIRERRTPSGHIVGFRIDITELIQAKEAAQAAERSKNNFLANMSHEIRTPMNAVLGMLSLLQLTALNAQQKDYAQKAADAGKSLLCLLNDILDVSKVNAGMMKLEQLPFSLDKLLQDLGVVFAATLRHEEVELLLDADPAALLPVLGDSLRLRQVLLNLGSNAIKFTEHGYVLIRVTLVQREDMRVRLGFEVRDTGIGIDPEFQKVIFDEFTQAASSTSRLYGGSGLGMRITHQLVALMGGELQLESALGQGSRFFFELDLNIAHLPDEAARAASPAHIAWREIDVLLVDDNEQARTVIERMCRNLGWTVTVCDSGEQAVRQLCDVAGTRPHYDVILMNGRQALEQLRQGGIATPVVLMTTHHDLLAAQTQGANLQDAADAMIMKPVTASALHDAVVNLWARRDNYPVAMASTDHQEAPLSGVRILLAEDNLINQQVARELLMSEGATVDIAANGQIAVETLRAAPQAYDVVLMDMQMPVMNGIVATQTIRGALGLLALPIVAMTANAMKEDREACFQAGMNDHVAKPLDMDELVEVILRQLQPSTQFLNN